MKGEKVGLAQLSIVQTSRPVVGFNFDSEQTPEGGNIKVQMLVFRVIY